MKHRVAGRKLGRSSEHRLAMLRNMSTALFRSENGRIKTTLAKAKELRPFAERLITLSKRETLHARRQVLRHIHDREVVNRLFDTLSARYAQRPGGYTRILKLGPRRGDNAELALLELVETEAAAPAQTPQKAGGRKKAARRGRAATGAADAPADEKAGAAAEAKSSKKKKKATTTKKSTGKKTASKKKTTGKKTSTKNE